MHRSLLQLLEAVTGSKLKPQIFIDYLNSKYKDIYGL